MRPFIRYKIRREKKVLEDKQRGGEGQLQGTMFQQHENRLASGVKPVIINHQFSLFSGPTDIVAYKDILFLFNHHFSLNPKSSPVAKALYSELSL